MGRLCARLAWKRVCMLLNWLNDEMAFSEGAVTRTEWLSDRVSKSTAQSIPQQCFGTQAHLTACTSLPSPIVSSSDRARLLQEGGEVEL